MHQRVKSWTWNDFTNVKFSTILHLWTGLLVQHLGLIICGSLKTMCGCSHSFCGNTSQLEIMLDSTCTTHVTLVWVILLFRLRTASWQWIEFKIVRGNVNKVRVESIVVEQFAVGAVLFFRDRFMARQPKTHYCAPWCERFLRSCVFFFGVCVYCMPCRLPSCSFECVVVGKKYSSSSSSSFSSYSLTLKLYFVSILFTIIL